MICGELIHNGSGGAERRGILHTHSGSDREIAKVGSAPNMVLFIIEGPKRSLNGAVRQRHAEHQVRGGIGAEK